MPNTCQKCGAVASESTKQCPSCKQPLTDKKQKPLIPITFAHRLAGLILALNGIVLIAEMALFPSGQPTQEYRGAAISLILGLILLAGYSKILIWVKISVVLGAVLFTVKNCIAGDMIAAVMQVAFSLALMLLIFGNPARIRIAISATVSLLYFAVAIIGFQQETTGTNFLTPLITRTSYNLEPLKTNTIKGSNAPYTILIDNKKWSQMSPEDASRDVPTADIWLVNPKYDGHILILTFHAGNENVFIPEKVVEILTEDFEKGSESSKIIKRSTVQGVDGKIDLIEATSIIDGETFTYNFGIFSKGPHAVQVSCHTFEESFQYIRQDCLDAIKSLTIETATAEQQVKAEQH